MSRKVYGGRGLLNLPGHHSTAAIVAEVEDTSTWPKGKDKNGQPLSQAYVYGITPQITCKITDCDSAVNIEFDVDTANSLENSLYKLDAMVSALSAMREGMIVEHHRYCDRAEKIPARQRECRVKRSEIRPSDQS